MKGYDNLILRVDFGSDGPDPIWRAGRRRLTPAADSAVARGEKLAGAGGSSATGGGFERKRGSGHLRGARGPPGPRPGQERLWAAETVTTAALGCAARRREVVRLLGCATG